MTYRAWLCCVFLVVVGCGGTSSTGPEDAAKPADSSGSDGITDGGVDGPTDGSMTDSSPDDALTDGSMTDGMTDGSMTDAMLDAPSDSMIDAPVDAMIDAPVDAMIDAPIDAPIDAMIDAPVDAMIDAPIDAPSCTMGVMPMFCSPGGCTDLNIDPLNCGMCGTQCASNQLCVAGGCVPNCMLTPAEPDLCNGACVDTQSDENNCGTCGMQCGNGQICSAGACVPDCQTPTPDLCNGTTCVDFQTDEQHCGDCTTTCTGGEQCVAGDCQCTGATPDLCGTTCTNNDTDPNNCGMCGRQCGTGTVCSNGDCVLDCQFPTPFLCNGVCTNLVGDFDNCGSCGNQCDVGGFCISGTCECPVNAPSVCNGACVNLDFDNSNCGTCGTTCTGGTTCTDGVCCSPGQSACGNSCADLQSDPMNCGTCGNSCAAGEQCVAGQCGCPYGQTLCNGACIPTAVDPMNCGACGNVCAAGEACVSNGCSTTCPPPLVKCGNECVDLRSDNDHCGSCSNAACTGNTGCSNGACVPTVPTGPPPAKCVNGGPPIVVNTGGTQTCTGNIGSTAFTYALCSRTDIGPLSQPVTTDAFDSTLGPYVPGQKGGSIGANGTINDTAKLTIGGDLRIGGASGMQMKGDIQIRQRFYDLGPLAMSKLLSVEEDAFIAGSITAGGSALGTITGTLTTPDCGAVPGVLAYGACATGPVTFTPPCGTAQDLIPVRQIVQQFENPANNDNAAIGLSPTALENPSGPIRLDLPCGYYHLTSIGGSQPITIVAHGHTALFVSGAINVVKPFTINLDPTSTFDIFVGGVMVSSQEVSIGNPAYPRLTRVYVGSASCKGTGTCTASSDCCSGICNAGTCAGSGGGGLSNALKLSSGSTFLNGLFYAGVGDIRFSNQLEMYGALFANYFDASGATLIHYDEGAVQNGNECPPPTTCETCSDCNNQACVNGMCGDCSSDEDCCQPLRCVQGSCEL